MSTRPYSLHCSVEADDPEELARVLAGIAHEIWARCDDLHNDGEVMCEVALGIRSDLGVRVDHDLRAEHTLR